MFKYISWIIPRRIASQIAALIVGSVVVHVGLLIFIASFYFGNVEDNPFIKSEPSFVRMVLLTKMIASTQDAQQKSVMFLSAASAVPGLRREDYSHIVELIPRNANQQDLSSGWSNIALPNLQMELGQNILVGAHSETNEQDRIYVAIDKDFAMSFLTPTQLESGFPASFNLLAVLGSFAIVLMFISVWAANRLGSPLSRLAAAASKFDADQPFTPIPEKGPTEVVKVAHAFNEMGRRTSQLVEDRTHLIAAVSHDLRTPITRLRLRAETVEDIELQAAMLLDLTVMDRMVHSAMSFIRDMKLSHQYGLVELTSLLQSVCDGYDASGRNVSLVAHSKIAICCDQDLIMRAVTNIIENGLKFGNSVLVLVLIAEQSAATVDIIIEDDGPGIPDKDKEFALKPFQRGDQARSSEEHEGFGLGLSICVAIAKVHGGKLQLEDVKPHGLRVRLQLPREQLASPSSP
jgi:signal transduction histidine kinase